MRILRLLPVVLAAAMGRAVGVEAQPAPIAIDNTVAYREAGEYDWTVFLVSDPRTLRSVQYVEYVLDQSFDENSQRQRVTDRDSNFALSSFARPELAVRESFDVQVRIGIGKDVTRLRYTMRIQTPRRGSVESDIEAAAMLYERAWNARDAAGVKVVWPSIDARAVARTFSGYRSAVRRLELSPPAVNGRAARSRCVVRDDIIGRSGQVVARALNAKPCELLLSQRGTNAWVIDQLRFLGPLR
jgi:hypothetical protein